METSRQPFPCPAAYKAGKKVGLPVLLSHIITKLVYHTLEAHVSFPQYILLVFFRTLPVSAVPRRN